MRWKKSRRIPKWIAGEVMSVDDVVKAYWNDENLIINGNVKAPISWTSEKVGWIIKLAACGKIKRAVLNPEWLEQEEYLAERRADRLERAAMVER